MFDIAGLLGGQPTTISGTALAAASVIVVAALTVVLLDVLYLAALWLFLGRRQRRRGPLAAVPALLACAIGGAASPLTAQSGAQVRAVQPQFTRLFSSDSLTVSGPAISPDGRWIVFGTYEAYQGNLWAVPAAGGDPVPVTTGRYADYEATFFPSGDRIAFLSNRPSAPGEQRVYVMTVPFDTRTGRAGTPRQVTLEASAGQALSIAPDGEWLVYCTRVDSLTRLMLVPSSGGTARTLAEFRSPVLWVQNTSWSADGRFVYYSLRLRGTEARSVWRVPAAGGTPQQLGSTTRVLRRILPPLGLLLVQANQGFRAPSYELVTFEGRPVARFGTPRNVELSGLTPDGQGFVAARRNVVAPIRVVPVGGGPARQLTEAREYDSPLGWTPDGSAVFVSTRTNGQEEILRIPVSGGPAARWAIPWAGNQPATVADDARHMLYMSDPGGELRTLSVFAFDGGRSREVTNAAYYGTMMGVSGPGGTPTAGAEFLYLERAGQRIEVRATTPQGPPRILRAFPASYAGRSGFAVHGDRVAWTEEHGDSTAILVADGRDGRPRRLATIGGAVQDLSWSHDGRMLALDHYAAASIPRHDLVLVPLGADATPNGPPRVIESGAMVGWQIEWLPDDLGFTVFGMTGQGNETHVLLVSLREGERPVVITRDDPSTRWGYSLSPDGRYVAYPAEISRGSSIWRVDLGDVLRRPEGPRR